MNDHLASDDRIVVIIPYYNGSTTIERAVQSVLEQSLPADEFVVVNDGSKPEETAFLHELAKKYPFQVIDKENGGQGSARNVGVHATTSRNICFLDQDDFFLPDHNRILLDARPKHDASFGWVYSDLKIANGDGIVVLSQFVATRATHPKRLLTIMLEEDMFVVPSATLISRKAFEKVGGFDEQFMGYEDDDLFIRLYNAGYSNHFIENSTTVWCIHGGSTSYSIKMHRSRLRFFKKMTERFPDNKTLGIFYFRNHIYPRFIPAATRDYFRAAYEERTDREELLAIFNEVVRIAKDQKVLYLQSRVYLAWVTLLTQMPLPLQKLAHPFFHFFERFRRSFT